MSVSASSNKSPIPDAFTFLSKEEYLNDLISHIEGTKKGDRVLVATMTLDINEESIKQLMNTLCLAARRGVTTALAIDARSVPILKKVPVSKTTHGHIKEINSELDRLKLNGGTYAITNETLRRVMNPFAGRSHIKTAIINDSVYIGGCNLSNVIQIDMMVRYQNSKTADWLYDHMKEVITQKHTRLVFAGHDQELSVDDQTKIYIDAGKPNQSVILSEALQLIDRSEEWLILTCQYFPSGITAKHLAMAYKRGVKVSVYYNHPNKLASGLYYEHPARPGIRTILHHIVLIRERSRHPSALFEQQLTKNMPYLHAKLIATEKGAILGSHNYVSAGVKFGTAEMAIVRHDHKFSLKAVDRFLNQIRLNS